MAECDKSAALAYPFVTVVRYCAPSRDGDLRFEE